jgi:hypothetical protein
MRKLKKRKKRKKENTAYKKPFGPTLISYEK